MDFIKVDIWKAALTALRQTTQSINQIIDSIIQCNTIPTCNNAKWKETLQLLRWWLRFTISRHLSRYISSAQFTAYTTACRPPLLPTTPGALYTGRSWRGLLVILERSTPPRTFPAFRSSPVDVDSRPLQCVWPERMERKTPNQSFGSALSKRTLKRRIR